MYTKLLLISLLTTLWLTPAMAGDPEVDTECKVTVRSGKLTRSRVEVEGEELSSGRYFAVIRSGSAAVRSRDVQIVMDDDDDEVEFYFDSKPRAGVTRIRANFIVNNRIVGQIYNSETGRLVSSDRERCSRSSR